MSLTKEEANFLRFYYLNLKVASNAARVYFDSVHPPAGLANELANSSVTLKRLPFITKQQLQILYPSPASNVKSEDFDTTIIVCLLRNMAPRESAPVTGWDVLPNPGDTSTGADLARIKWYRNKLAHDGDGKLSPTDFSQYWIDLECAIGRLGGPSLMKEAQSAHHIVLDKFITDLLNKLRNCEKDVYNLQMSQDSITSMINDHTSAIDNQGLIKQEHEQKIQELTIKFKEIEHKLTTHNEHMATCEKNIDNLKRKQIDSDDSSVANKRKRLEDYVTAWCKNNNNLTDVCRTANFDQINDAVTEQVSYTGKK
ncbi:unnamed protein product [Mytilus coruscus]|uniref:DZIP3-like HEPN domain-containing protein n=1 Tax=Mytilus coruscus TaxID=42192 RepID=A0A6J8BZZ2_MYTCO|nr:unnamed protein product [Mytilus coruscus]